MKIVALGDSITEGFPYSPQESWVEYAARDLDIQILNQGVCGDLTLNMCERFQRDVVVYNPTHVILLGGTNDAIASYLLAEVSTNFIAMVAMSRLQGIIPILGLPIPSLMQETENILREYRNWLKDYANKENLSSIDFYTPFWTAVNEGQASKLFTGDFHPGIEGYELMGKIATRSLKEICKQEIQGKWGKFRRWLWHG